ncbi:MAG TPA: hypothetical protein VIG30_06295 [Ktedonobacterales bacterium]|jgi:hypothetical protein
MLFASMSTDPVTATGQGALVALAALVVAAGVYFYMRSHDIYLGAVGRGIILLLGGIVSFAGMFSPVYVEHYNPPKGFPTTINGHVITAFTKATTGFEGYNITTDPTGRGFLLGFFITIILTSIVGLLYLLRGQVLIPLARNAKGLSLPMILFLVFVIIVNLFVGGLTGAAQSHFVDMLGDGKLAEQAFQYYTVTAGIGLWLLAVGIAIIVFGTYAPRKPEPIEHPGRHLAFAVLQLVANIALVIIHPSFPTGSFLYTWLYPVLVVGIPASVVSVAGAFFAMGGVG